MVLIMPRSLLALKDRYGKSKIEDLSPEDQDVDVEEIDDYEGADVEKGTILTTKGEMGVSTEVKKESAAKYLKDENDAKKKSEEHPNKGESLGGEEKFPSKEGSSSEESKTSSKEPVSRKRSNIFVPEIELNTWHKLVCMPGTSSNAEAQRSRYQPVPQKIHRPWETRDRCDSYPIRSRASFPINRFISTEFGHLGVRNQRFTNEGFCTIGRQFCKMGPEDNWMISPAQYYASHLAHYGRPLAPRECYSCISNECHEYLRHGRRDYVAAYEKHMAIPDRFRMQYSQQEQEALKPIARAKHADEESQKKQGFVTHWPEISSQNFRSSRLKGERTVSSTSPTFEYVSTNKATDAKERPFSCTICGKSFKRRSSLATHKFIHTDLKPHVCGECNKRFLRKSDLKKHSLMHSGKKPYECKECGRRFSQSSNMLTHLRRHMGIRPFECKICTRSFFRKVDLKRHEGRHIAKTMKTKGDEE